MVKILAVGDIHGDKDLAKYLGKKSEQVDITIICGDLTNNEEETNGILSYFKNKVLIIPGNHESFATINFLSGLYKNIVNIHDRYYLFNDIGFFGCGSANIGIFRLSEQELFNILTKASSKVKTKKRVMITHVHPSGTKIEKFSTLFQGSNGVKQAIGTIKPDILLCSHVHEAEGIEEMIGNTKVINVGRQGNIFEI